MAASLQRNTNSHAYTDSYGNTYGYSNRYSRGNSKSHPCSLTDRITGDMPVPRPYRLC